MPNVTVTLDPIEGPILPVGVSVSRARREALLASGENVPPIVSVRALVDTGASCTCVDPSVLQALSLPATGTVFLYTPSTGSTPHAADEYDVGLVVPGAGIHHLPLTIDGVPVVAANLAVQGIHALIGRDVLQDCILIYNGTDGDFTLAF